MPQRTLSAIIVLFVGAAGPALAASQAGIVLEVTSDTITIKGENRTATFKVCAELLTNSVPFGNRTARSAKFTEVKKGSKIRIEFVNRNGEWVCTWIEVYQTEQEKENEKDKKDNGDFNNGDKGDRRG